MPTKPSPSPSPSPQSPVDTRFGMPLRAKPSSQGPPRLQTPQSYDRTRRHSFGSSEKPSNPPQSSPPPPRHRPHRTEPEKHSSQLSPHLQPRPHINGPPAASPRPRPVSSLGKPMSDIPRPNHDHTPSLHHRPSMPPGRHEPNHDVKPSVPGDYPEEPIASKPSKQSKMGRFFGF